MTSSDRKRNKPESGSSVFVTGNLAVMIMMLAFVLLPACVQVSGAAHDTMTFFGKQTPSMCFSKTWFDMECVTCGLTRSFSLIAHGRITEAFQVHLLGPLLYVCMAAEAVFRGVVLAKGPGWVKDPFPKVHAGLWAGMVAALLVYWIVRLAAG